MAALLGLGFVGVVVAGHATLLVRPWFTPVLVATGVLLLALVWSGSSTLPARAIFIVLLPLAAGIGLTPSVVGRVSQGSADPTLLASRIGDSANPLLAGKAGNVTLLQILLADQSAGAVYLAGRQVTVEAITSGPHELKRSVIVCCAADARTIRVDTSGVALPRTGTWVRVSGQLAARGPKTIIHATSVVRIPTPARPFL